MKKNRDVIVISSKDSFYEIVERYKDTDKKSLYVEVPLYIKLNLENNLLRLIFISLN